MTADPGLALLSARTLARRDHAAGGHPGCHANLDQACAAVANALASYGVDVADPTAARALLAVADLAALQTNLAMRTLGWDGRSEPASVDPHVKIEGLSSHMWAVTTAAFLAAERHRADRP